MKEKLGPYHVVDLPVARRDTPNSFEVYWWKHSVCGLLEVDVTVVRQFIAAVEVVLGARTMIYSAKEKLEIVLWERGVLHIHAANAAR